MYWNQTLRSVPLDPTTAARLTLRVDVDAPGDEGARLRVEAEPTGPSVRCGPARELFVAEASVHPLPRCDGEARFAFSFLNDRGEPDRNVYFWLDPR
jgi:hypothetical protein